MNARKFSFQQENRQNENYYSYMSSHSEKIIKHSVVVGAASGFFSARHNLRDQYVQKATRNIGIVTLLLFGIKSIDFLRNKQK